MPLRFWIDEYAFSEGETAILRENIYVRPARDPPAVMLPGPVCELSLSLTAPA